MSADWGRTSYTLTSDDLKPLYEMGVAEFMRSKGFLPGAAGDCYIDGELWKPGDLHPSSNTA